MKLLFILITLLPLVGVSQHSLDSDSSKTDALQFTEQMPEFPGGNSKMMDFLIKNIQYPDSLETIPNRRIYAQFIVNVDGQLDSLKVYNAGPLLEKEIIRVLKLMPKWSPGKLEDKKVAIKYSLPIHIHLQ